MGQSLLYAAVAPIGDHDVDMREEEIVGNEPPRRTLAGRPVRSGAGSGPPVVATNRRSSPPNASAAGMSRRCRSALSSVPW